MQVFNKIGSALQVIRTQGMGPIMNFMWQKLHPRLNEYRSRINEDGSGLIGVVDIGSVGGLPAEWRYHAEKISFLLSFEPRDTSLVNDNVVTLNAALWSENCTRDFHIYKGLNGQGSSLFLQNYEYVRQNWEALRKRGSARLAKTWFDRSELVRTEKLKLRTLDDVIQESMPGVSFHFVKIDAQGAEYEILKGAERLLQGSCIGLHLELFVIPLYKGIRLLPEVEQYLAERGFRLVKKFPARGTFDSQHDCLFMKEGVDTPEARVIREVYDL